MRVSELQTLLLHDVRQKVRNHSHAGMSLSDSWFRLLHNQQLLKYCTENEIQCLL